MSAKPTKPDINAFLASLAAPPPPTAATPEGKQSNRPRNHANAKQEELDRVREVEAMAKPGEAEGLNTATLSVRTWEKKRIMLNEPGIACAVTQITRLPEPGETFHSIMGGDFHGFDLIPAMQRIAGQPLTGLRIATYSFSQKNILQLCKMIDTGLVTGPVTLVVSIFFAKTDPNVFAKAQQEIASRGGTLAITRNHAKVIAARLGDAGEFIVCETSANLRSCLSLEQFTITGSRELYEFHRAWIEHIATNNTTEAVHKAPKHQDDE